MPSPVRDSIFISYSTRDSEWLELVRDFLQLLAEAKGINVWDSSRIQTGEEWRKEIGRALDRAVVALCLVSQSFLRSAPVRELELPKIDQLARRRVLSPVCIPLSSSTFRVVGLERYQWARSPDAPLDLLSLAERNRALVEIASRVTEVAAHRMAAPGADQDGRRRAG